MQKTEGFTPVMSFGAGGHLVMATATITAVERGIGSGRAGAIVTHPGAAYPPFFMQPSIGPKKRWHE